jgi:MoaA/NifB/PqqE/SkfB family radical SAM enzyme
MDTVQKPGGDSPFLRNVGLFLTYHCQASCAHCIVRAGPDRHEEMNLNDARDWIRQIASYRNHYVYVLSLTGGEPFSNLKLLRDVMEAAVECKLLVSVVTNAFWATKRHAAKQLLESLPKICFISISTDSYHQKYVPFERVKNAIWAARECGIPYYISVVTEDKSDPEFQRLNSELVQLTAPGSVRTGITFPLGRAAEVSGQLRYKNSDEPPKEACQAASSPCIFPDARVYGCIGPLIDLRHDHPLLLGNLRDSSVSDIFDRAETSVGLHALRLWGPNRLISLLREAGLGDQVPKTYIEGSVCNACYNLLSDALVRGWLRDLEQDADFRKRVAYGRLYYLNETEMLELGGF